MVFSFLFLTRPSLLIFHFVSFNFYIFGCYALKFNIAPTKIILFKKVGSFGTYKYWRKIFSKYSAYSALFIFKYLKYNILIYRYLKVASSLIFYVIWRELILLCLLYPMGSVFVINQLIEYVFCVHCLYTVQCSANKQTVQWNKIKRNLYF